jgi:hypothetical protein
MRPLALLLVGLALVAGAASAQQFSSSGFVGRINRVALGGDGRLFVFESSQTADGTHYRPGLRVLDVADPTYPLPRGFIPDLIAFNLKAAGARAYVVGRNEVGLHVIDATDPDRPTDVGSYRPPTAISEDPAGIALSDGYVYAIEQRFSAGVNSPVGVRAISVADPTRPTAVGFVAGRHYALAVLGQYLYAVILPSEFGAPYRLAVYSLAEPTQPVEVGSFPLPSDAYPPDLIAAEGGRVYLANVVVTTTRYDATARTVLRVLDVSSPAAPIQVGALTAERGSGQIVAAGARLYLSQYAGGVKVIDVSDPAHPAVLGAYALPGLAVDAFDAAGTVVYAGELSLNTNRPSQDFVGPTDPALEVADLTDPANGRELGRYNPASRARLPLVPASAGARVGGRDRAETGQPRSDALTPIGTTPR